MREMKLTAGQPFPSITVSTLAGGQLELATPSTPYDWRLVVVYRGKHCPICTRYLVELRELKSEFNEAGIDVVAVSADTEERAKIQTAEILPNFQVGYGLTIEQMQTLGLYISSPRSEQESDRPFAEPGMFVINENRAIQIIDISNFPFGRPDLGTMLSGLKYIRAPENSYPIRGTY